MNLPLAVNPRGTSGSGKTTLARRVMELYQDNPERVFRDGRRRPIYTIHQHPKASHRALAVLGHYEAACGGCDTITVLDDVFSLARELLTREYDVLLEGLILSGEIQRTLELAHDHPLHIYALTTPVDECVANVNKRREARGVTEPVRPKNTVSKARCVELTMKRIGDAHIAQTCEWASFDSAFGKIKELLRLD